MKNMKLKMFGEKSISAVLFWVFALLLLLVIISAVNYIPDLIEDENSLIALNIAPLISYLALLIPLVLLFYAFKKKVLFTKQSIKYLHLFALTNFLATIFNWFTMVSFLDMEYVEVFSLSFPNILLITFAIFLATIFKQGSQIQQENELTI
ncbi:hypothetical protein [uncultured Lacinutrix sp.]|uniref:hypothetical protein n=1 Tax=uncultured Lacinutrix sp. TaxID=574032 RepID=UPI002614944B|nr:hypothetical protein [uncultured Lacinutrix sp.]